MQVLNLSFSKNGTFSMTSLLGGPILHGRDITFSPRADGKFFLPPLRHKYKIPGGRAYSRANWDAGLGEYVGASDISATYLWSELMDSYPEAKVVLFQRHFEKWFVSWRDNIINSGIFHPIGTAVFWLEGWFGLTGAASFCRVGTVEYFGADTREEVLARAQSVYAGHYEAVRERCRREGRDLLEYRLGDGLKPLATFFGKPVPEEDFPHLNEKEEMRKHQRDTMVRELRRGMGFIAWYVVPVVAVVAALLWSR